MDDKDFANLLAACSDIAEQCHDGAVYIGGIAVYLHAINAPATRALAAATHDADLFVSFADMGDLRDREELTPNRRLSKHQLVKNGFEFDLYVEHQSGLAIPYDTVRAHAREYPPFRVAALEHLLVLKLDAYAERKSSRKGDKDAQDLLRLAAIAKHLGFDADLVVPYLREEHVELLAAIERGPHAVALARGNVKEAKSLRSAFSNLIDRIDAAEKRSHDDANDLTAVTPVGARKKRSDGPSP